MHGMVLESEGLRRSLEPLGQLGRLSQKGLVSPVYAVEHADSEDNGFSGFQDSPSTPKTFWGFSSSGFSTTPIAQSFPWAFKTRRGPAGRPFCDCAMP